MGCLALRVGKTSFLAEGVGAGKGFTHLEVTEPLGCWLLQGSSCPGEQCGEDPPGQRAWSVGSQRRVANTCRVSTWAEDAGHVSHHEGPAQRPSVGCGAVSGRRGWESQVWVQVAEQTPPVQVDI